VGKLSQFLKKLKKSKKLIRMTIVGDGAVGKTTLVQALIQKTTNFGKKSIEYETVNNKAITRTPFMEIETWNYKDLIFQCYDLAGQRIPGTHPLDLMRKQVTQTIDIYIFVFSVDRYESFENLNSWIQLLDFNDQNPNGNTGLVLVGNKIDLEGNISNELVESVVGKDKLFQTYVETCSLDGRGVENLLEEIATIGRSLLNN
jgi:small GTP-binding protein